MRQFFQILKESFLFALHALAVNKLRSVLSLTGITIGILAIVGVFTFVDSLERNIRSTLEQLGSEVIYVQKWPFGGGGEYPWWKYYQRPEPTYKEMELLQDRIKNAAHVAYGFKLFTTIKNGHNYIENAAVLVSSHEYYEVWTKDIVAGRYFSNSESQSGSPVAVIGADIAEGLFGNANPIGREFKALDRKIKVIGLFEKEGQSFLGDNVDDVVMLPAKYAQRLMNINNQNNSFIMVTPQNGVTMAELRDELQGVMRSIRRLHPKAEDDFAMNELSMLSDGIDNIFGVLGVVGMLIGGFSILVGGFGIANIMFVSVKERTNQIGIQKSLGAKNYFILSQFLLESVILCIIGGSLGILIVGAGVAIINGQISLDVVMSMNNVITGMIISAVIGVISGIIPAYSASRLNPVDAMRA